jgi:hypothetical protein
VKGAHLAQDRFVAPLLALTSSVVPQIPRALNKERNRQLAKA